MFKTKIEMVSPEDIKKIKEFFASDKLVIKSVPKKGIASHLDLILTGEASGNEELRLKRKVQLFLEKNKENFGFPQSKVTADDSLWTTINPNLKPSSYTPGKPLYYWGIAPDGGFNYSSYQCDNCGNQTELSHDNYCPYCKSQSLKKLENKEVNSAPIEPKTNFSECRCGLDIVTNSDQSENTYCPNCGDKLMLSNLSNNNDKKQENGMKTKAALLKIVADLYEKGEEKLAQEMEKLAALDSGVDQVPFSGQKGDMEDKEKMTLKTEEIKSDEDLEKAVAQVQKLLKYGIEAAIVKKDNKYVVKAADEVKEDDIIEETAEEKEPEILDEATAQIIINASNKKGKNVKATRVESGYVLAFEEDINPIEEIKDGGEVKSEETLLPEDKAGQIPTNAEEVKPEVTPEVKSDDSGLLPAEKIAEKEEIVLPTEASVRVAVAAIQKSGKHAKVTKVLEGFTVHAEEKSPIEEVVQDAVEDSQKVLDDLTKEPEVKSADIAPEVTPVPPEAAKEELQSFDKKEEEIKQAAEEEFKPEIMEEEEANKLVASLHKQGKKAQITRISAKYFAVAEEEKKEEVVAPETKPVEEVKQELPVDINEKIEEVKQETVLPEEKAQDVTAVEEKEEVKFETILPIDEMKAEDAEDVTMLAQGSTDDAFYNVIIKGSPVARINLKDQVNAAQIKDYFNTEQYAMDLVDAMLKFGVKKTLAKVNAKFYANEIVRSDEKVTAKLQDEFHKKYAEAVATVRDDLADRLAMVIAASNKNFFKDDINRLKVALFDSITANLEENKCRLSADQETQDAIVANMIESGFEQGAAPFFGSMLDKAIAYLDMPKEALASLKQAIGDANIQTLEYEEPVEEEKAEEAPIGEKSYASWSTSKNATTGWKTMDEISVGK